MSLPTAAASEPFTVTFKIIASEPLSIGFRFLGQIADNVAELPETKPLGEACARLQVEFDNAGQTWYDSAVG